MVEPIITRSTVATAKMLWTETIIPLYQRRYREVCEMLVDTLDPTEMKKLQGLALSY